jgi:hypothetical protein
MKTILALISVILLSSAAFACGDDDGGASASPTESAAPTETAPPDESSPTGSPTASPTQAIGACPANPDPADITQVAIAAPHAGDVVTSPVDIEGVASAFEAVIQVTLLDGDGNELYNEPAMTSEGQTLAPFQVSAGFTVSEDTPGCIQVYMLSGQDGSPINFAQMPLVFAP